MSGEKLDSFLDYDYGDIEIIGNCFENPELKEGR